MKKNLLKEAARLQKLAGIIKENLEGSELGEARKRSYNISDIDFTDDGNRDQVFSQEATDEDIQNYQEGNVEVVYEDSEYGGTWGVYKLPSGQYLYAFEDGDYYAKTAPGVQIIDDTEEGGDSY